MSLAESDINYLRDIVAETSGNVFSSQQGYLFESRLQSLAEQEGHSSVGDFVGQLRRKASSATNKRVAEAMTINETFFFRDMHLFNAVRDTIVPSLLPSRQNQRQLTIWSAACSTGQEPYSLAMTLKEYFPQLADWNLKVIATDICDEVLQKAKSGTFSQFEVNRGLPAKFLVKYFVREGVDWKVHPNVRKLVEFRKLNLATPWPQLPVCDLVLIRNVLIYFSSATKESILRQLQNTMAPDGYLLLGGGETLIKLKSNFERETVGETICYRQRRSTKG